MYISTILIMQLALPDFVELSGARDVHVVHALEGFHHLLVLWSVVAQLLHLGLIVTETLVVAYHDDSVILPGHVSEYVRTLNWIERHVLLAELGKLRGIAWLTYKGVVGLDHGLV